MKCTPILIIFYLFAFLLSGEIFATGYSIKSLRSHTVYDEDECNFTPWFTGPLLAPSATNQDPGSVNLQPYFFYSTNYGFYSNTWSLGPMEDFTQLIYNLTGQIGVTKNVQFQFSLASQSTFFRKQVSTYFSDFSFGTGIQFLWDEKGSLEPNLRLIIMETFPTGRYDRLDPFFEGNNGSGLGVYSTMLTLDVSKILYQIPCHPIFVNISINLAYDSRTKIRGVSVYGGGTDTDGDLSSRFSISGDFAAEYAFTQNWIFALDFVWSHNFAAAFKGNKERDRFGNEVIMNTGSSNLLTLSPAIEYSFSPTLGMLIGGTFSFLGRNLPATAQGIASVTWTF